MKSMQFNPKYLTRPSMKNLAFVFILIAFTAGASCQDTALVRQTLNILCSPSYEGRGYVKNGDKKAAAFIVKEFQKNGIQPFLPGYMQAFTLPVNTFPGRMTIRIGNTRLKPGIDYLVDPGCPSVNGRFNLLFIRSAEILSKDSLVLKLQSQPGRILWIDDSRDSLFLKKERQIRNDLLTVLSGLPSSACRGVLVCRPGKLTWSVAQELLPCPMIYFRTESCPDKASSVVLHIRSLFIPEYTTSNVAGYIRGTKEPDSVLILMAHYDHLGRMGRKTYFPGANDNASGTAMVLDMARYYSRQENAPHYTMVFLLVSSEEAGLVGSQYFAGHPLFPLGSIKFLLNIDMAGHGSDGITVVNGSVFKKQFEKLDEINRAHHYLPQVKIRGAACNSDHCPFYVKGVPSFFIYTMGGAPYYHDIYDTPGILSLKEYIPYFRLITGFLDSLP